MTENMISHVLGTIGIATRHCMIELHMMADCCYNALCHFAIVHYVICFFVIFFPGGGGGDEEMNIIYTRNINDIK